MKRTAMRNRRLSGALVATFVFVVSSNPALANSDIDPADISAALNFRETFGFSTDVAVVSALEASPTADRTYSVALTQDEVADLDRRMAIQDQLLPLLEYGRSNATEFGGMYVDQAAGGAVHLGFTKDVSRHTDALAQFAPQDVDVNVDRVKWTESDLAALHDEIAGDLDFHQALGVTVNNIITRTSSNAVEVLIEPFTSDVAERLESRYGPAVVVLPGAAPQLTACTNRDNCPGPPIRAGISNDWGCTVGFAVLMDGQRRFLTAGHCVYQVVTAYGWGGWTWFHQSTNLGLSTDHSWYDMRPADAGSMGNVPLSIFSNDVLFTTAPFWYNITSTQAAGADWQGMAICQSGQTSGYRCGTITSTNTTPDYGAVRMKWQRQASYMVQVGDSGAPVVSQSNPSMGVGLQSGRDALYIAYYSHIAYVQAPNGPNGGIGAVVWTFN